MRGFDFTGRPSEGAASGAPTKATANAEVVAQVVVSFTWAGGASLPYEGNDKSNANADPSPLKRVRDDSYNLWLNCYVH